MQDGEDLVRWIRKGTIIDSRCGRRKNVNNDVRVGMPSVCLDRRKEMKEGN